MIRQRRVRAETTIRGMIHSILDGDSGSRVTVDMLFLSVGEKSKVTNYWIIGNPGNHTTLEKVTVGSKQCYHILQNIFFILSSSILA